MKNDFVLEIGVEDLPARYVPQASEQLGYRLEKWLQEHRIAYGQVRLYATPRRLSVYVDNMATAQEDQVEEVKGPAAKIARDAEGNWTKAALGFARSQAAEPDALFIKEFKDQAYVYVRKHEHGKQTEHLLADIGQVIKEMTFPKNMRWGECEFSFLRPIRWLVALFGKQVISFELAGVQSGNRTQGHRFLGQEITLPQAADYAAALAEQYVIVDASERRQLIVAQIRQLEQLLEWQVAVDEELLEEVTFLVEYPSVVSGAFEPEFLDLPEDILMTSMQEHQRYFPVRDEHGKLLPFFVTIRNGLPDDEGIVTRGNEKVLRARLADAQFFFDEDQKQDLSVHQSKLEQVVYYDELGTVGDKTRRIREVAEKLATILQVDERTQRRVDRAAEICKFDLVTLMVDEFPTLQGKIGQVYASRYGEEDEVAQALYEHYLPRFAGDVLPQSATGAILSVADKLDTLVSCFSIGLIPSGSQDPYALRRQAAGLLKILIAKKWDVNAHHLLSIALNTLSKQQTVPRPLDQIQQELDSFFALRLRHRLDELEVRYDVTEALMKAYEGNIQALFTKAQLLMNEIGQSERLERLAEVSTRVSNLSAKLPADVRADKLPDAQLFANEAEHELYAAYSHISKNFEKAVHGDDWAIAYEALFDFIQPVGTFFEQVMVMTDDLAVRNNRLLLLRRIEQLMGRFASFADLVL